MYKKFLLLALIAVLTINFYGCDTNMANTNLNDAEYTDNSETDINNNTKNNNDNINTSTGKRIGKRKFCYTTLVEPEELKFVSIIDNALLFNGNDIHAVYAVYDYDDKYYKVMVEFTANGLAKVKNLPDKYFDNMIDILRYTRTERDQRIKTVRMNKITGNPVDIGWRNTGETIDESVTRISGHYFVERRKKREEINKLREQFEKE